MNYYQRRRTDPDYNRIMNGSITGPNGEKWPTFARLWRLEHQVCEVCGRAEMPGIKASKLSVHHKRPISSFGSIEEKRRWAFAPENLQVLCVPCHAAAHRALGSYGKERPKEHAANVNKEFLGKFLNPVFKTPGSPENPKSPLEILRRERPETKTLFS